MHQRQHHRLFDARSNGSRLLMLLLCLLCWRGPIPYVHAHHVTGLDDGRLIRHLETYHKPARTMASDQSQCPKWHMHWLLPWGFFTQENTESDLPQLPDPLTEQGVVFSVLNSIQIQAALADAFRVPSALASPLLEQLYSLQANGPFTRPQCGRFSESLLVATCWHSLAGVSQV